MPRAMCFAVGTGNLGHMCEVVSVGQSCLQHNLFIICDPS